MGFGPETVLSLDKGRKGASVGECRRNASGHDVSLARSTRKTSRRLLSSLAGRTPRGPDHQALAGDREPEVFPQLENDDNLRQALRGDHGQLAPAGFGPPSD